MKRVFRDIEDHALGESEDRGVGGPLRVSSGQFHYPLSDAMVAAGVELGLPRKADLNDGDQEGVGLYSHTIHRGRRWSAARAFLDPAEPDRPAGRDGRPRDLRRLPRRGRRRARRRARGDDREPRGLSLRGNDPVARHPPAFGNRRPRGALRRRRRGEGDSPDVGRRLSNSGFRGVVTSRMGRDNRSVVDERLAVRGVEGLRVIDCSVMPSPISGNTNGPAMAMAARAADLFQQETG